MVVKETAIEKEIAKFVHVLTPRQKKTVLNVVKTFAEEKKDWWDELSTEQIAAMKEAELELEAGKGVPHEQVMKKYKKWL